MLYQMIFQINQDQFSHLKEAVVVLNLKIF